MSFLSPFLSATKPLNLYLDSTEEIKNKMVWNLLAPCEEGKLCYNSDGDAQSPLVGLKFAIWGIFFTYFG